MYHSSHNLLPGVLSNWWVRKQGGLGWSQSCFFGGHILTVESRQLSVSSGLISRLQEFKVCPLPSCVCFYMTRNKKLRFKEEFFSRESSPEKKHVNLLAELTRDHCFLKFMNTNQIQVGNMKLSVTRQTGLPHSSGKKVVNFLQHATHNVGLFL